MENITNEIKSIVFAVYLGQNAQVRKKNDSNKEYLTGRICEVTRGSNHGDWIMVRFDDVHTVTNQTWNESSSNAHTFFFGEDETKLILKPLSSISDEDCHEVNTILGYHEIPDIKFIKRLLARYFAKGYLSDHVSGYLMLQVIQFLQSKGYDLPMWILGGKTLHECNLAIYQ